MDGYTVYTYIKHTQNTSEMYDGYEKHLVEKKMSVN